MRGEGAIIHYEEKMNRDVFIGAPLIKEIHADGTTISTDAYIFNPAKVIWMKTRYVEHDLKRPYTIIKLEETEPFMCEGESSSTFLPWV